MLTASILLIAACGLQAASESPSTLQDRGNPAASRGFRPQGAPVELYDIDLLARLRDPAVQAIAFSSYDRKGGNNDGFNGTYSRLRTEDGNSVLAEVGGPGVIQRIWFTHTSGERPGLLDGKQEHIKVFLDQNASPALDIPLERIFDGTHPQFPRPLVGEGSGGYLSYVPIPFRNGCKVVVEGQGVRFYQINLITLPPDTSIESFREPASPHRQEELAKAVLQWSNPVPPDAAPGAGVDFARYVVDSRAHSEIRFGLRPGPATLRCLEIQPADGFEVAWREARLRITWDASLLGPGVDVPIGPYFGRVAGAVRFHSLLLGEREGNWYCRFPMPYRKEAILRIDSRKPIKGVIRVHSRPGIDPDAGYLRAQHLQSPTQAGQDFSWLKVKGRGHFAGVFMMTRGKAKLPYWLEGDDRFRLDERLAIHGTGSEDYFNCGWYALEGRLDRPGCYPSHGFPVYRQVGEGWEAAAYRWHLADPIPFARSIDAGIEHGGDNAFPADYSAVVYWYSENPGPAGPIPPMIGD